MHPATLHYRHNGVGVITTLLGYISTFLRHLWIRINELESRSEVIQGHRFWPQSEARLRIAISGQ